MVGFLCPDIDKADSPGTPYVYGQPIVPCVVADGKGNTGVVMVGPPFQSATPD